MPRTVRVHLDVPEGVSDKAKQDAERQASEAAVITLWKLGELTIREGADALGLSYREYLDLLDSLGVSVEQGPPDLKALDEARQKLSTPSP